MARAKATCHTRQRGTRRQHLRCSNGYHLSGGPHLIFSKARLNYAIYPPQTRCVDFPAKCAVHDAKRNRFQTMCPGLPATCALLYTMYPGLPTTCAVLYAMYPGLPAKWAILYAMCPGLPATCAGLQAMSSGLPAMWMILQAMDALPVPSSHFYLLTFHFSLYI